MFVDAAQSVNFSKYMYTVFLAPTGALGVKMSCVCDIPQIPPSKGLSKGEQ